MYRYNTDSPKDSKLYDTREEAEKYMINHMTFGVLARGPIQINEHWIYRYCNELSEKGPFDTKYEAELSMSNHKSSDILISGPFQIEDDRYSNIEWNKNYTDNDPKKEER